MRNGKHSKCASNSDHHRAAVAWFAAHAKPNAVHIAARNLVRQGLEVFLPLERYTLRRGRSLLQTVRPYFAGYFFVRFDPEAALWRVIRSTYGESCLVSFSDGPARVSPELVAELMTLCDEAGVLRPRLDTREGDSVLIAEGPLADVVGRRDAMAPNQRA
jgi:transcriptional antiterminator RfaH